MSTHLSAVVLALIYSAAAIAFCLWLADLKPNEPKKKTKKQK